MSISINKLVLIQGDTIWDVLKNSSNDAETRVPTLREKQEMLNKRMIILITSWDSGKMHKPKQGCNKA